MKMNHHFENQSYAPVIRNTILYLFIIILKERLAELKQQAEHGTEESQIYLAKYFIRLADSGISTEENKTQALDWLISASKQGSEEATDLLRKYVDCGMGKD